MAHPASWQNQVPPDEAGIMRRLEDIERQMRELGPAIQLAVGPQIATLIAQQATLVDLVNGQIQVARFRQQASNFAVTTSFASVVNLSLTVPADVTRCVVIADGYFRVRENYPGTSSGFLYGRAVIGAIAGDQAEISIGGGQRVSGIATSTGALTSLASGDTVAVSTQVQYGFSLGASADNLAAISGVVFWLR